MKEPHLEIWPWQDRLIYALGAGVGLFYAFGPFGLISNIAGLITAFVAIELGRRVYLLRREKWFKAINPISQVEHLHTIIRAEVKNPFTDPEIVRNWLIEVVKSIGMNITEHGGPHVDYVQKENNCGIAAIVMIETSHIAIHVWDQQNPPLVQMDIYSCSKYNPEIVKSFLYCMNPTKVEMIVVDRKFGLRLIP